MVRIDDSKRPGKWGKGVLMLKKLAHKIKNLFALEEVEVTYFKVGKSTKYSYTKVDHKHLAS